MVRQGKDTEEFYQVPELMITWHYPQLGKCYDILLILIDSSQLLE
jgi:hypothetical protein